MADWPQLANSIVPFTEQRFEGYSIVRPTTKLQAAQPCSRCCSGLEMCSCVNPTRSCTVHDFYVSQDASWEAELSKLLKDMLIPEICRCTDEHCCCKRAGPLDAAILGCQKLSGVCLHRLRGTQGTNSKIRNEQELRYAVGDPIIGMLCDLGPFKVCKTSQLSVMETYYV